MQSATISRILGFLLILLSLIFIPPMLIELWYQDGNIMPFELSFGITFFSGIALWILFRSARENLRTQDGFLLVVLFWLTASAVSALPFYLAFKPSLSLTDAFFESVSGITTTGSTIFTDLDILSHSILFYRQQLQFLGGISIIILAVAMLPTLGIGGMQLFRTEFSGPVKDDKVLPRITEGAKAIWFVYLAMTVLCAFCYWAAGMDCFDAISHSFSTVSTGGFSTHNDSLAFYNSATIQCVACVFMLFGSINFNLHFLVIKRRKLTSYFKDPELRFFLKFWLLMIIFIWSILTLRSSNGNLLSTSVYTFFETTSFITTTGFSSVDLTSWPLFISVLLLFLGVVGGCAGSTSGGLKAVRVLLLQKQASLEIHRLIHPHGQYVVKLGQKPLSSQIMEAIWGFIAIYFVIFVFLFLLLLMVENDFFTAYTTLIAALSNTGRVLSASFNTFAQLSDGAKWILSAAMLIGRLEIFTILVLLSPVFWRR